MDRLPCISLWQPWASWVAWGLKSIETRTHNRFATLRGRTIGIHAANRWDLDAFAAARGFITEAMIKDTPVAIDEFYLPKTYWRGCLVCLTAISAFGVLRDGQVDDQRALCRCDGKWGYELTKPLLLKWEERIVVPGRQGVFYIPVDAKVRELIKRMVA